MKTKIKKDEKVELMVTEEMKNMLREKAKEMGLNISGYIRNILEDNINDESSYVSCMEPQNEDNANEDNINKEFKLPTIKLYKDEVFISKAPAIMGNFPVSLDEDMERESMIFIALEEAMNAGRWNTSIYNSQWKWEVSYERY